MGLRFQKRIKIAPGVTINLSNSGISASLGRRGAKVTVGHGQTRTTLGIPGSGISHTTITKDSRTEPGIASQALSALIFILGAFVLLAVWILF